MREKDEINVPLTLSVFRDDANMSVSNTLLAKAREQLLIYLLKAFSPGSPQGFSLNQI